MEIKARESELTAILARHKFDMPPGDVTDPHDLARWRQYRFDYHNAQQFNLKSPWPLQVDFELTSKCNMKCSFCTHGHETVPLKRLSFEQFQKVIDEGKEHGLCSIKLNYINEPLLVRDLPRYIRYAKQQGVLNIYFATNGTLLDKKMAEELIDAGLSKIMVSLDAATPATFKVMRNSDKFDQIIANIMQFLEIRAGRAWPLLRVNFLRTELNQHEADLFLDQWTGVADMIGYQTQVALPGMEDVPHHPDAENFRCSFPNKLMVVDSNGDILPCCTFSGRLMPMGNIDSMTIAQAWTCQKMKELKLLHRKGNYMDNPICAHCIKGV